MDAFGEEGDGDEGVVEVIQDVSDFVRDVEEGGKGEGRELVGCELACPAVKHLQQLGIPSVSQLE